MTTRTIILNTLRAEPGPMTVAELAKRVGVTHQLARHHVRQLCATGEVEPAGVQPSTNGKQARTFRAADGATKEDRIVNRAWPHKQLSARDQDTIRELIAERDALRKVLARILENEASDWKAAEEYGGYVLDDELREEARAALTKGNIND